MKKFFQKYKKRLFWFSLLLVAGTTTYIGFQNNQPRVYNVTNYGAFPDGNDVTDAAMSSNTTVTSATAGFKSTDVGKSCIMYGSGAAGINQYGTITGFTNATTITVSFTAAANVSAKEFFYGTEAQSGIQAAINAAYAAGGGIVYLPYGIYYLGGALVTTTAQGFAVNSQLYIPQDSVTSVLKGTNRASITLEGEFRPNRISTGILGITKIITKATIIRSVITGTGTIPAILSSPAVADNFGSIGVTDMAVNNLVFKVYTNQGTVAPTMGCINGTYVATQSGSYDNLTLDVIQQSASDPSGNENFGWIVSSKGDDGPNHIDNVIINGFKYGIVPSEHTFLSGVSVEGCVYGCTFPNGDNEVTGSIFIGWCKYPFYSPSSNSFLSGTNHNGPMNVNINAIIEIMDSATRWYGSSGITNRVLDTSSNLHGFIRQKTAHIGGLDESDNFQVYNAPFLQIISFPSNNVYTNNSPTNHGHQIEGITSNGVFSAYNSTFANYDIGSLRIQGGSINSGYIGDNMHLNGSFTYDSTGFAAWWHFSNGDIVGRLAPSGTINTTITPVNIISLNQGGSFGLGGNGTFGSGTGYTINGNTTGQVGIGASTSTSTAVNLPASSTTVSSLRLAAGTFPTSPVQGDLGAVTGHLYYRDGSTTYDLLAAGSTPTLQQVLTAGATLTGANTIISGGFNLAYSGTGHLLLGTATDNGELTVAGVVAPEANLTRDLGTSSFAWRDIYYSHTISKSVMGSSTSLGTNITSATASGSDEDFQLVIVSSASVSGTVCDISFGRTWIGRPNCVVSAANAVSGAAIFAGAGSYISANATSTSNFEVSGNWLSAQTITINCHCGQ